MVVKYLLVSIESYTITLFIAEFKLMSPSSKDARLGFYKNLFSVGVSRF